LNNGQTVRFISIWKKEDSSPVGGRGNEVVGFDVLTAVSVKRTLIWEVTIPDYTESHTRIHYSTRMKPAGESDSIDHYSLCLELEETHKLNL
jgi:hypothetical protein